MFLFCRSPLCIAWYHLETSGYDFLEEIKKLPEEKALPCR